MERKPSGEASQAYLMLPSPEVCIRTLTLAEVSVKIHACSQVPRGSASEQTVEHPSLYPQAGLTVPAAGASMCDSAESVCLCCRQG